MYRTSPRNTHKVNRTSPNFCTSAIPTSAMGDYLLRILFFLCTAFSFPWFSELAALELHSGLTSEGVLFPWCGLAKHTKSLVYKESTLEKHTEYNYRNAPTLYESCRSPANSISQNLPIHTPFRRTHSRAFAPVSPTSTFPCLTTGHSRKTFPIPVVSLLCDTLLSPHPLFWFLGTLHY